MSENMPASTARPQWPEPGAPAPAEKPPLGELDQLRCKCGHVERLHVGGGVGNCRMVDTMSGEQCYCNAFELVAGSVQSIEPDSPVQPTGGERDAEPVCPVFGCHAPMEPRMVCVRCGYYKIDGGVLPGKQEPHV